MFARDFRKYLAEASGSRTHLRHRVPHAGFEDQTQHRPRLASTVILALVNQVAAEVAGCVPPRPPDPPRRRVAFALNWVFASPATPPPAPPPTRLPPVPQAADS